MDTFLRQFQHLKIQLEEITSATNNFDDQNNYIGRGGFGKVYKGVVSHSKGRNMAAIKRLDPLYGQGIPEFLKEITTLSRHNHINLISLLGFCYQGDEMILVYEYASRGSLDRHLNSPHLTWTQRLKICVDVAKVLRYLHDPKETHQRLIHCDMKSANILLDDHWNAKLSDFGLSVMGPANELHSVIVTNAAGTHGYCDPQYAMTHTLTKESDVYSFGVVLFEVLCGTLCYTSSNGCVQEIFVPKWIESYKQKKLNDIIFKSPTIQPLDQSALEIFSDIGYRCLKGSRDDRPKMAEVVTELESALETQELLESQEFSQWKTQLFYYEEITKSAEPPLNYRSKVELMKLLYKGVLLNGGKTYFSLNKKGEHCEMISFVECLDSAPSEFDGWSSAYNSRFAVGSYPYKYGNVKTRVKTQFLSPGITYTVNLVFKFNLQKKGRKPHECTIKYKLQGDTKYSVSYFACEIDDGWWMCELYQFISDDRIVDLQIQFDCNFDDLYDFIFAEGIEFRPLEKVEHIDDKKPLLDSDANWEEKLPNDYEDIMKWSTDSVQWTTKKEVYSIICKGFLMRDDKKRSIWFFLDENGKKCHMLSARAAVNRSWHKYMLSFPESRFGEVLQSNSWHPDIESEIKFQLLSSETTYASYLVYKLPKDQSGFEGPIIVFETQHYYSDRRWYIYLASPQTPVIRPKADQNTHNPLNKPKIKGLPRLRSDGWMEVQMWEFRTDTTANMIPMRLALKTLDGN